MKAGEALFDPIAYINEPRWQASRLGLERIAELLDRMGRPQDALRFVHVAGTNGKGSTCAYLASVLQAAGYRTGLFTSPYILRFEERIRVNGTDIPFEQLSEVTLFVKHHAEAMQAESGDHPTEFELMTAVALEYFKREGCDIAVLEVGLGGRLDSTNVIEAPEVAVIARIGLDHTALLGTTLSQVAAEKVGIVKAGSPVVSWPQDPEAMEVVRRVAAERGCVLHVPDFAQLTVGELNVLSAGESVEGAEDACDADGLGVQAAAKGVDGVDDDVEAEREGDALALAMTMVREFSYGRYGSLRTRLLGSYQPFNATVAIEAVEVLRGRGWRVSDDALYNGIAAAVWPGRFEVVAGGAGQPTVVVDGGHNPQGAEVLVDSLRDAFPDKRPVLIMGVLADKDYQAMVRTVAPLAHAFVTVTPENPRALTAAELADEIRAAGREFSDLRTVDACAHPITASSMAEAVAEARRLAGPDGLVCAFGSLYSIAELKAVL